MNVVFILDGGVTAPATVITEFNERGEALVEWPSEQKAIIRVENEGVDWKFI